VARILRQLTELEELEKHGIRRNQEPPSPTHTQHTPNAPMTHSLISLEIPRGTTLKLSAGSSGYYPIFLKERRKVKKKKKNA
jgi:hypothetical protein